MPLAHQSLSAYRLTRASAPLGNLRVGNFFGLGMLFPLGGPMTVQRNQNRHPNFLPGTIGQLTLLGAATLVLLFFAWTYLD
jgi:hypothetical protein